MRYLIIIKGKREDKKQSNIQSISGGKNGTCKTDCKKGVSSFK